MADRMQFRRDTAANWMAYNPILLEGELGFELDTDQYKLGDGVHNWNALPYRGLPCVQQRGTSVTTPMSQKAVTDEIVNGCIFDVSANNLVEGQPSSYASLYDVLNANPAVIPTDIRKGGMSIKFINSTTSQYEQWRLMATSWSTNESNWQGATAEVKAGNLDLPVNNAVETRILESGKAERV